MRVALLTALWVCICINIHAQEVKKDSSNRYVIMDEVVVSATKFGENKKK